MKTALQSLYEGQTSADARKTKVRAIIALIAAPSALSVYAVAKAFWPDFPLSVEEVGVIIAWLMSGVGVVSHIISTQKLGLKRPEEAPDA